MPADPGRFFNRVKPNQCVRLFNPFQTPKTNTSWLSLWLSSLSGMCHVNAAQVAQHLDRVAALADSVAEVRAAASTAEAQGKRGLEEVSRLREQKVLPTSSGMASSFTVPQSSLVPCQSRPARSVTFATVGGGLA